MKTNPYCISYWFPKLQEINRQAGEILISLPETIIVESAPPDLIEILEGNTPAGIDGFYLEMLGAAIKIGYPCFLRSGVTSDKYDWVDTCFVKDPTMLVAHISRIVEFCAGADILGLPSDTWAIRKFLQLETAFTAFRGGMPINKERRYFIEGGKVICHHPYWPPEVFAKEETEHDRRLEFFKEFDEDRNGKTISSLADPLPANWRELLSCLNLETPEEVEYLTAKSELVSRHFEGTWSLDWAMTKDGKWYAIDMALAERSFHWPGCIFERVRTIITKLKAIESEINEIEEDIETGHPALELIADAECSVIDAKSYLGKAIEKIKEKGK
jgi:hypothetical protein